MSLMFTTPALTDLVNHMEWADREVWRAVSSCEAAGRDARLRDLLLHLHVVQRAFVAVWTNTPPEFPSPGDFGELEQLRQWSLPYYVAARAFMSRIGEGELSRHVVMPWAGELAKQLGREPGTPTLAETIFQVTSHSTYHRGQVNARLRELGGEPPLVDYIAWIWFGRPA